MTGPGQGATAVLGEQFFVTHCITADSVMNAPGYSVRAASTTADADVLKLALEYPPYELPLELWRERPGKAQSPRRLARTHHPRDGVWVVHSVYLEKDTMNRDRSYFSHLLLVASTTTAAEALRSWDASGWTKDYPQKAEKMLPRSRLPVGTAISDEALVAFLAGPVTGPADLAVAVCPSRFRADAGPRRDLLARFLQGLLLAIGSENGRDRIFVVAEPGLVAMLLYAAARILPPAWVSDLTFSTFEPAHRGLRDYRLATVVGTYCGPAGKGLDPDLIATRGYGLDTFQLDRSSRELLASAHPELSELIELSARGEWDLLADVHQLVGSDSDALDRVSAMIPLARALARLNQGEPTIEDLLALRTDPRGEAALQEHAEAVWPRLRAAAMADARIRIAFKNWLAEPKRLEGFRRDAVRALQQGDLAGWDRSWIVVQEAAEPQQASHQLENAIKGLDEQLPNLPFSTRNRLRAACLAVGLLPDHHLLAPTSSDELAILLSPNCPPDWQGYTCFTVMAPDEKNWLLPEMAPIRQSLRDRVRAHLLSAPPAMLRSYLKQVSRFLSTDPSFLYSLLQPHSKSSLAFLDRLVDVGASIIEPRNWTKLLSELNVYNAPEWEGFLYHHDHLAKLLSAFRADPTATKLWEDYLGLLSAELFDGDAWETALHHQLKKARQSLEAAGIPLRSVLPADGLAKLIAIDRVLTVLARPAAALEMGAGQLLSAFQTIWPKDPHTGLLKVYRGSGFDRLDLTAAPAALDPFVAVFLSCFPITHEYFSARSAVGQWLVIGEHCPLENRAAFQGYLIQQHVPAEWYPNLLEDNRRVPFLPEAEARIRESLAAPASSGGRYSRSAARRSSSSTAAYSSAATKRAKKSQGQGRGAARRSRANGISAGVWAVIVVGAIALALIIAAVIRSNSVPTKPTEPEPQAQPAPAPAKAKKTTAPPPNKAKPAADKTKPDS